MFEQPWEFALVLGTVVLYLLALVQFVRSQLNRSEPEGTASQNPIEGDQIPCRECGTANEQGYRYCRSCVAELPQSVDFDGDGASPLIRGTR